MEKYANRFSLPNEVIILKLSAQALAVYAYLLYCCDRETYKCYPSYATIEEGNQVFYLRGFVDYFAYFLHN